MAVEIIRHTVHGRIIEIGCYGSASDWLCRLTYSLPQPEPLGDSYCPPADAGYFWLRETGGMWLASGAVNRALFCDADTVDKVLYRVMHDVIQRSDQLASRIQFVAVEFTATFDGELGPISY